MKSGSVQKEKKMALENKWVASATSEEKTAADFEVMNQKTEVKIPKRLL